PMSLKSIADYDFLLEHAIKQKTPSANLQIEVIIPKKNVCVPICSRLNEYSTTLTGYGICWQKKSKTVLETPLNMKLNAKIQLLKNQWMCSKPGCSSEYCFIHPEHPEHFPLGHEHFSVWAAAWNKDDALTDLQTPPNHNKFNAVPPGKKSSEASPLLQCRLAERNQASHSQSGPVINSNIPPKILNTFHRNPTIDDAHHAAPVPAQPRILNSEHDSVIPPGMKPGPDLSLDDFCIRYKLSDDVKAKLSENGYFRTETIEFIVISELKEMGFKFGEIAAMKAAMKRW
ncbi:hypothetical protein BU15DRAFT_7820, partial [Melanogaster broomeanus]